MRNQIRKLRKMFSSQSKWFVSILALTVLLNACSKEKLPVAGNKSSDPETKSVSTNGYRTMYFTNSSGQSVLVHIYETNPNTQDVDVAVYEKGNKQFLVNMNISGVATAKVQAKTNCAFMTYGPSADAFYGLFYTKSQLYLDNYAVSGPTDERLKILGTAKEMQYWPCFCIRTDRTTAIRWPTYAQVPATVNACKTIISGGHPLVYEGKNIFLNTSLKDNQGYPIFKSNNATDDRFRSTTGDPFSRAARTFFGQKSDKSFIMVCVSDSPGLHLKDGAKLMLQLGCTNAINCDGGGASQMRVKNLGKVIGDENVVYGTGLIAFDKE